MTGRERSIVVQARDRRLFRELDVLRFADREQVKMAAGFGSTTRVNARLLKLTRAGLLRRVFVGTIVGGRKAVYMLSPKGAALAGVSPGPRLTQSTRLAGNRALDHQLELNEIYLTVKHRRRPEGVRFLRWIRFVKPLMPSVLLIPDGYFEIEHRGVPHPLFVEVDLGTESLKVWKEKTAQYLRLAISGDWVNSLCLPC